MVGDGAETHINITSHLTRWIMFSSWCYI